MRYPAVDVVIPTYHPGQEFHDMLLMLRRQTLRPSHILIVNTEEKSWDDSLIADIPEAEVFHISKKEFDHGATRNMGAGFSGTPYVVFMTQDAMPADRLTLSRLIRVFQDPRVKVSYARQLPRNECRIIEGYTRSFNYPDTSRIKTEADIAEIGVKALFCSNVCAAYDKEYFTAHGGFDHPSIFNEDMLFAARVIRDGGAVAYVSEARVIHSHNYTAARQFHRNFDNGVSQAMHPEIFEGIRLEGEGVRLVKQTAAYLNRIGRIDLIPSLLWESVCKYAGYRLGKIYRLLPRSLVYACTDNRSFWDYRSMEETEEF